MFDKRKRTFDILTLSGFSFYFVILFVERLLAVILSPSHGAEYALKSGNAFNYIAYSVTALSLAAGTALFLRLFIKMILSCKKGEGYLFEEHVTEWVVAAFVLLFGGMMHTGFTLAAVQFAAYGFLIAAMTVRTVVFCTRGENKFSCILSLVYLTLFSMSIPVCYISFMQQPLRAFFFAAEFLAAFLLVPAFGCLLLLLMKKGVTSFSPVFPALMCALSGAVVALGWREDKNLFVLIFASLTLACYLFVALPMRKRLPFSMKEKK